MSEALLAEARDQKEKEAAAHRAAMQRYLTIAEVATKGIVLGAIAGEPTAIKTLQQLLPLLPARKPAPQESSPAEPTAAIA
ncbi:MAG: hypothetical protein ABMA13_23440 [Chthoniobacteraceae bacterium]